MTSSRPATVYYSRRTLLIWAVSTASLVAATAGAVFFFTGKNHESEICILRKKIYSLTQDSANLRAANARLAERMSALKRQVNLATPKLKTSLGPTLLIKERTFPVGEAVVVLPGHLFVTVYRVEGDRARIRVAQIRSDETKNTSRILQLGQVWKFSAGEDSFALLFHSLEGGEVRLSIRKLSKVK